LGRFKEPIADYDRAIGLDGDNAAAYIKRCLAKSDLGLHVEAINYDELMRRDPDATCTYRER